MKTNLPNQKIKFVLFIFLLSILFKPVWLFDINNLGEPGQDDLSYWLHSATIVYDSDIKYQYDYQVKIGKFDIDTNIPYHPPGAGYLSAPFVYVFSFFDNSVPERLNPVGSFAYLGFFTATLFYFLLGSFLLSKALRPTKLHQILFFSALVGTTTHFVTTRFMMSHSVEFFLCSAIIY